MFIDYVPLMLINMSAGLFLLACYLVKGIDSADMKMWAAAFMMVGIVAFISGWHMTVTWPLPGSYNVAFGQMSVLLGILFLGAVLSLCKDWSLVPVAIYGFFAGLAAIVIGLRIINLGMTKESFLSGIGFILTGLSGVLACPVLSLRNVKPLRLFVAVILVTAAFIWARTGYIAYWMHLSNLSKWLPPTMR